MKKLKRFVIGFLVSLIFITFGFCLTMLCTWLFSGNPIAVLIAFVVLICCLGGGSYMSME